MIVVTGASGFIGQALVEKLLQHGEKVLAVSRSCKVPEGVDCVSHDVRRPLDVDGNVEAVIHLAGMAAARSSFSGEWEFFETNVLSTINMAKLALEKRALFILASSAEVYGATASPHIWFSEEDCVTAGLPSSPYAVSKISAEAFAKHYALRGLRVVILRPANTYGRLLFVHGKEAREYFIEKVLCLMLARVDELSFDGFGESMRQWMYYPDHVDAYITVLYKAEPKTYEIYNIAGPKPYSLKEVIEIGANLTGWRGRIRWGLNPRPLDPNFLLLKTSKLRQLGWSPRFDLPEGLSDYLKKLKNCI